VWIDPNSSDQVSLVQTNIVNYVDPNSLQFITGNKSLDKNRDAYVKGFDNLNLNGYLRQMQKAWDSSKISKQ
jgi:putative aldouronate transport system substrate-binding protein